MNSITGATLNKAQTQLSVSSVVLKKTFEADQKFADAIDEAANLPPPPPGTGKIVDKSV
jgi:hypothetical protein|tara:strand:+ start:309 stop:485 length:177 start_codon:yes stop_codon:yes gene_type:complete